LLIIKKIFFVLILGGFAFLFSKSGFQVSYPPVLLAFKVSQPQIDKKLFEQNFFSRIFNPEKNKKDNQYNFFMTAFWPLGAQKPKKLGKIRFFQNRYPEITFEREIENFYKKDIQIINEKTKPIELIQISIPPSKEHYTPVPLENPDHDLVLIAIFQNEARFLKEWIEYHLMMGVKHIYLGNHNSTDHWEKIVKPYVEAGIVEVETITYVPKDWWGFAVDVQCAFYNRTISRIRDTAEWAMILDLDEYWVLHEDKDIPTFLKRFPEAAQVSASWRCFGTSEVKFIGPEETRLERLRHSGTFNERSIKSIFRPRYAPISYQHMNMLLPGYEAVMADGSPFLYRKGLPTFFPEAVEHGNVTRGSAYFWHHQPLWKHYDSVAEVYHYMSGDETFFIEQKMKRIHVPSDYGFSPVYINEALAKERSFCPLRNCHNTIQDRVPELRRRMGLDDPLRRQKKGI
jgi:hypothetical protein